MCVIGISERKGAPGVCKMESESTLQQVKALKQKLAGYYGDVDWLIKASDRRSEELKELEKKAEKLDAANRDLIDIHNHDVEIHISLTKQLRAAQDTIKTLEAAACPWRRTDYVCHCADCSAAHEARKRYAETKRYDATTKTYCL